jgi:hypothetical protein
MTVLKSVRSRKFLAALSALAAVAAMLFGANVASGDEVWYQSYQRGSASEACVAQVGETPWQDSWGTNPGWSPSWAKWANEGQGGWVCDRSIAWAQTPAASSGSGSVACGTGAPYAVGDIGPGCGTVFLISGGLTYEMAPKNWGVSGAIDPTKAWTTTAGVCYASGSITAALDCQTNNLYPETTAGAQTASTNASTAIGMGSANTDAIIARMAAGSVSSSDYAAGLASAYAGVDGLTTDWFLPSQDELNAMCNYSRNPTTPPTGTCTGAQNVAFSTGAYGFASDCCWSSSQYNATTAWDQGFSGGGQGSGSKGSAVRVRPVRAF